LIRLAPTGDFALLVRGRAHCLIGEFEHAVRDFTEAIRLGPDNAKAYEARAQAFQALGDGPSAELDRKQAAALRQDRKRGSQA
jgi:Flp pilus assembly protein TadD